MTIWAILPAAGIGRRMGSITPKQYLSLNGAPVLAHSLRKLAAIPAIKNTVVVLHPDDTQFATLGLQAIGSVTTAVGGEERFQSVLNGLQSLAAMASDDDWVLVHDAVRPCVRVADIERLISSLRDHATGGLLGVPAHDTLKRVNAEHKVVATVDRSEYWHAQTPQMFRYGLLVRALQQLLADKQTATDEAAAIERLGLQPQMVAGHTDNIKITREVDLVIASTILKTQEAT